VFDRKSPTLLRATRLSGSPVIFDTNIRVARKGVVCAAIRESTEENVHVEGTESYPVRDEEAKERFSELDIRSSGMFSAFFGENLLVYRPYVLSMYRVVTRFRPQRSMNRPTSNLKSVKQIFYLTVFSMLCCTLYATTSVADSLHFYAYISSQILDFVINFVFIIKTISFSSIFSKFASFYLLLSPSPSPIPSRPPIPSLSPPQEIELLGQLTVRGDTLVDATSPLRYARTHTHCTVCTGTAVHYTALTSIPYTTPFSTYIVHQN
jgi:hypothetical protein